MSRPSDPPPRSADPNDPSRIGNGSYGLVIENRYEVQDFIARGGMGEVYRAYDARLRRAVAVKMLPAALAKPALIDRFRKEIDTLARIDHPGIVPIYDFGRLPDGRLYYAMKLVSGLTFADLIEKRRTRDRMVALVAEAAEILHFAHTRGVLHLDLKPANLMADESGRVFVLDWGIARAKEEAVRQSQAEGVPPEITAKAPGMMGTLRYMSPEQARGAEKLLSPRSDVYSLGAVFYEILTGRSHAEGTTINEIMAAVILGVRRFPRAVDPSISPDLEAVCLKALDVLPGGRYATAKEFADDLRRYLAGRPVKAGPQGISAVVRRVRRHPWIATGVAAALLAVAGLTATIVILSRRADRDQAELVRRQEAEKARQEASQMVQAAQLVLEQATLGLYSRDSDIDLIRQQAVKARELLDKAVVKAPDLAPAHFLLGRTWDLLGWGDRAEECWKRCVVVDPAFAPAHLQLGRLYVIRAFLQDIRYPDASGNRAASASAATVELAIRELQRASAGSAGLDDDLQRDFAFAMLHYARGEFEALRKAADAAVVRYKGRQGVEDFHWLAGVARSGDEELAEHARALAIRPKHMMALFSRASVLRGMNRHEEALRDYDELVRLAPRFADAWYNRSGSLRRLKRYDEAIASLDRALELDPSDAASLSGRGVAWMEKGDLDRALAEFGKAIQVDPKFIDAWVNRGMLKEKRKEWDGAIADYTAAIELHPSGAENYANRADAREGKGDYDGAIRDYGEAIRRDPSKSGFFNNRGAVRVKKGDFEAAIVDYGEAIRLDPGYAKAYYNRALARRKRGDKDEGLPDLEEAVRRDPRELDFVYMRAMVRDGQGDVKGAIADYRETLRLAPADWPDRAQVQEFLDALLDDGQE